VKLVAVVQFVGVLVVAVLVLLVLVLPQLLELPLL
jgi:hypothetical protein